MRNARLRGAESHTSTTEYKEQIILFVERIISKKLPQRAFKNFKIYRGKNKLVKRRRCQQRLYFGFDVKIFAANNFE